MADITQLETAFMKAHEAGDTQAASTLAAEIKRQKSAPTAPEEVVDVAEEVVEAPRQEPNPYAHPSDRYMSDKDRVNSNSLASGMLQSVADIPNVVSGITSWTGEKLDEIHPLFGATVKAMNPILNVPKTNIKVPRIVPKGENPVADALRTGGEWGTPIPFTKFNKLVDPLMAGGAALGEYLTDGSKAGEIAGGFTGLLASFIRGKPDGLAKAQEFIKSKARDPEQAVKNYVEAINRNETGTLAELTKDPGIFNLEAAATKGSSLKSTLDALSQGRLDQSVDSIKANLGAEVPYRAMEDVAGKAEQRTSKLEKSIAQQQARNTQRGVSEAEAQYPIAEAELTQATKQSDELNKALNPNIEPSDASSEFSKTYDDAEKTFRTNIEKPAWDKFSKGQKLDVNEVISAPMEKIDEMNPTDVKILTDNFSNEMELIKNWSKNKKTLVEPNEVHSVISQIKAIRANAKANGTADFSHKLLGEVQDGLETSLKLLGSKGNYDAAVSATKEKMERFRSSRVGNERGKFEPQTFAKRLLDTKEGGAVVGDLIKAADSPQVTQAAKQYLKSIANRDGVDKAFMANYSELLNRFPGLKTRFSNAKKAQDELVATTEKVKKLPQAIELQSKAVTTKAQKKAEGLSKSIGQTQVAKLKNDADKFIDDSLVNNSVSDLTKLNKQLSRVEGGQEALKLAIKERILSKITKTDTGKMEVPASAVGKFDKMKRNLIDSGILTKDEVIAIENKLTDVNKTRGLRSDSAKQMEKRIKSVLKDVASSGMSVAAMNAIPGGHPLVIGGMIRRNVNRLLDSVQPEDVLSSLETILANPSKFAEEAAKAGIKTDEQMIKHINQKIRAVTQSVADDEEE